MSFQQTFKALSDSTRRKILSDLKIGPLSAGEIASRFAVSDATISHHLQVLKSAGLILDEKRGKYIYYKLNLSVMEELLSWVTGFTDKEDSH